MLLKISFTTNCQDSSFWISDPMWGLEWSCAELWYWLQRGPCRLGYSRAELNAEGKRIMKYEQAFDFLLGNTCFKKHDNHLMYILGNAASDWLHPVLQKYVQTCLGHEADNLVREVHLQHQLLVHLLSKSLEAQGCSNKLLLPESFDLHVIAAAGVAHATTEEIWTSLKSGLLKTSKKFCSATKRHRWRKETWW